MAGVGNGSQKIRLLMSPTREKEVSLVAITTNLGAKNIQEPALIYGVLHLLSMKGALGSSQSPRQWQQGDEVNKGKSMRKKSEIRVPRWVGHGEEDDVWE